MANPIQEVFAEVLLDRIRRDMYPSTTHMDMFEAIAPPRQLGAYVAHLMERIEAEQHPSISMMQRVQAIATRFNG
jgi:hypothetical protein